MPAEFWRSTPRVILAVLRGYHRRRGWLAWHTAGLGRIENFPDLHQLTGDDAPDRAPMSADEIDRNIDRWVTVTNARHAQGEGVESFDPNTPAAPPPPIESE